MWLPSGEEDRHGLNVPGDHLVERENSQGKLEKIVRTVLHCFCNC